MRVIGLTVLLIGAGTTTACDRNQADQNISITNNIPADAEIEALPPDEGSDTAANELAAGADNGDVSDLNSANNAY